MDEIEIENDHEKMLIESHSYDLNQNAEEFSVCKNGNTNRIELCPLFVCVMCGAMIT